MDNTDENINSSMDERPITSGKKGSKKLNKQSSRNSISTQTSLVFSPVSGQNSILSSTHIQSAILCRICYSGDGKEHLLQPCDCSGTMGLIHRTCLEKWLSQCNKNQCEICNFNYDVNRKNRPYTQWLFRPITTKDSKNLLNDLLCFLILTPLAFISIWYCIGFAFTYTNDVNRWESSGLVILTTFLVVIYFLWLTFSSRYHYKVFKEWQEKNQIITLQIDNKKIVSASNILNLQKNIQPKILHITDNNLSNTPENNQISLDIEDERQNIYDESDNLNNDAEEVVVKKSIYKKESAEVTIESCVIEV